MLDEPFNGLDEAAAGRICQILRMLPPQTLTLLVSHQLAPIQGLNVSFFSMDDPGLRRRNSSALFRTPIKKMFFPNTDYL